ncbi:hypothetical protein [Streptomyces sp. NPDC000229]|uniref:hypothetical protein n=1 Tax=Streptomyces sp. NPDC000229 TaxID=3154247 RepID=UPI003328D399
MSSNFYELYGAKGLDIHEVRDLIAQRLGVPFEEHESSYKGGVYYRHSDGDRELTVEMNWTDEDGYLSEPHHEEYAVLVYATRVEANFQERLNGDFTLLRSEEL